MVTTTYSLPVAASFAGKSSGIVCAVCEQQGGEEGEWVFMIQFPQHLNQRRRWHGISSRRMTRGNLHC